MSGEEEKYPVPILSLLAGWLVPGAGHFLLGERARAAAFAAAVLGTFALGLAITGGNAVSWQEHPVAFVVEAPAGLATLVPVAIEVVRGQAVALADDKVKYLDLGLLFCMMAGLWNLLLAVDAYERAEERLA